VILIARGYLGIVAENRLFAGLDDLDVVDLEENRVQFATRRNLAHAHRDAD
jgi:hypothetical protein